MQTKTISLKFREAALMFLETGVYESDSTKLLKHTDALLYKFTLSVINLEFLWRISQKQLNDHQGQPDGQAFEWNNINSIIDSTFLESTIVQIRAFIDFAQKLSSVRLGYHKPIDGTKDFYKILDKMDNEKSKAIRDLFLKMDNDWGNLIRSLRNKIMHYGLIKTNHEYRPRIQDKSYEEFAQSLTNNMFYFLIELNTLLLMSIGYLGRLTTSGRSTLANNYQSCRQSLMINY